MRAHPHRGPALGVAGLLTLGLIAGCSEDPPEGGDASTSSADAGPTPAGDGPATPSADAESATADAESATAGPGDTDSTTATADQAGGIGSADGAFAVTLPGGWGDVTDQVSQDVEIAVRAEEMTDDFFTNLVVASEEPVEDLETTIEDAAAEVAGDDGDYRMLEQDEVAGDPAYGYVVTRTSNDVEVSQTQRWVEHGGRLYVITFSTASSQQQAAGPLMEEILVSWEWQD
jgi:hypothetical protein